MTNETIKINETERRSKPLIVNAGKGDCTSCPYKANTTSGICATYSIYKWCRQTMGEDFSEAQEPTSFNTSEFKWVDSTPNCSYPVRLLRAYLDYTETKTEPPELGDFINELQHSRNALLEKAIEILNRHKDELRAVIEDPMLKNLPDLAVLDEINEIRKSLDEVEKALRVSVLS